MDNTKLFPTLVIILAVLASGCSTLKHGPKGPDKEPEYTFIIDKVPVTKKFKGKYWVLTEDFTVMIKPENGVPIPLVVPKGFVTDKMSFPKMKGKRYDSASIVHDYHFWVQPCVEHGKYNKKIANKMFKQILKVNKGNGDNGVNKRWSATIKYIMSKFSSDAWSDNTERRDIKKMCRFVPEHLLDFTKESIRWSDIDDQSCASGVHLKTPIKSPDYCDIYNYKWPKN